MPSATTIRKHLLQALEERILPQVQETRTLRMILAQPPIDLPPEVKVTHLPIPPLQEAEANATKFGRHWIDAHVNNFPYPYLAFVFEGEADLRVGTTQTMVRSASSKELKRNSWRRYGCHILHLPAPAFVLLPPGVPYSDGSQTHWERDESPPPCIKILWIHLLPIGVLCHLCKLQNGQHDSEHPLLLQDTQLPAIAALLQEELREAAPEYQVIAQSYLVALFFRLRRQLIFSEPGIGNTAWLSGPELVRSQEHDGAAHKHRLIELADEYIQTHLIEPISLPQIAEHCGVSPTHLNRIFNSVLQVSVKRYVNRRRINAAQRILEDSEMSIKEVAHMTGFSQVSHFCQVFAQVTSTSPGKYREQSKTSRSLSGGRATISSRNVQNKP